MFLLERGDLFHDDTVADFGGNDGYAANEFYKATGVRPLVVDCEPKRLGHAWKRYGLSTLERFIESMPEIQDGSVDWSFCSHTLEHSRDPLKAVREIRRVTRRGAMFVVPVEEEKHGKENHAHSVFFDTHDEWREFFRSNGWKIVKDDDGVPQEYRGYMEPV